MIERAHELIAEDARVRWQTPVRYSICTMVTRPEQHRQMVASFLDHGFGGPDCEYLQVDNSHGNPLDGYRACNLFLSVARGDYIIICHQDIVLLEDGRERLDRIIAELDRLDPTWALIGNSGCVTPGRHLRRISDPHGENQRRGPLPGKVFSLDENFILARRDANLAASHDLAGFHLYGTDLCVIADVMGRSAYAVDFHLRHLSGGTSDESFALATSRFAGKYARAIRPRWIATPSALLFLCGSAFLSWLMNSRAIVGAQRHLGLLAQPRV